MADRYGPWIDWPGGRMGEMPIPHQSKHQVKFRDGRSAFSDDPGDWDWHHTRRGDAPSDIIAYRVAK